MRAPEAISEIKLKADLARLVLSRIRPIGKLSFSDPTEDAIELCLADEKRIVLRDGLALHVHVVEICAVRL